MNNLCLRDPAFIAAIEEEAVVEQPPQAIPEIVSITESES